MPAFLTKKIRVTLTQITLFGFSVYKKWNQIMPTISEQYSVLCQINRKNEITIQIWFAST